MTIEKGDLVLVVAGLILLLIIGESIYWLHIAATWDKDKFDLIVKGTLLPLFIAVAGLKIGYTFLSFALNKFSDKGQG
jgi:hypothetical protein